MRGELLIETLVFRSMHDDQDRREQHHNEGAERARDPRKRLEKARALSGRIEEDGPTKHWGARTVGLARFIRHTPSTRIYALSPVAFQCHIAASCGRLRPWYR